MKLALFISLITLSAGALHCSGNPAINEVFLKHIGHSSSSSAAVYRSYLGSGNIPLGIAALLARRPEVFDAEMITHGGDQMTFQDGCATLRTKMLIFPTDITKLLQAFPNARYVSLVAPDVRMIDSKALAIAANIQLENQLHKIRTFDLRGLPIKSRGPLKDLITLLNSEVRRASELEFVLEDSNNVKEWWQ